MTNRLQGPPIDGDLEVWDATNGQWALTQQIPAAAVPPLAAYVAMPFTPEQHGSGGSYNAGTDETAAVLAAINAASTAGGGTVWLSRLYQITSIQATVANVTIYTPSNTCGLVSSLAKSTSNPALQLIGSGNHVKNIRVTYNTATNIDTDGATIAANASTASAIIVGGAIGAAPAGFASDVSVEDCIVQYARATSVMLNACSSRAKALHNYCQEQGQGIIIVDVAADFEVASNTVTRSIDDLVAVLADTQLTNSTALRGRVHHNDLSKGYAQGIDLTGADGCTVDHNTIDTTWNPGILVWQYTGTGPTGPDFRTVVDANIVRNAGTYFGGGQYKTAASSGGHGIDVSGQQNIGVVDNQVYGSLGNGIQLDSVTDVTCSINQVTNSQGAGINVSSSSSASKGVQVVGNNVTLNNGAIIATGNATFSILDITIANNQIRSYKNGGAGSYRGIFYAYLTGKSVIHGNIIDNDNGGAEPILEFPSGHSPTLRISNNPGFNPVGVIAAPAVPASGVAYTNTLGFDCTVFLVGGTVSAIAVNGQGGVASQAMIYLPVGGTITITYTVAPTWTFIGQ